MGKVCFSKNALNIWQSRWTSSKIDYIIGKKLNHILFSNYQAAFRPIFKEGNIMPIPSIVFLLNITLENPTSVQETLDPRIRQKLFPTRSSDNFWREPCVRTTNFGYNSITYKAIKASSADTSYLRFEQFTQLFGVFFLFFSFFTVSRLNRLSMCAKMRLCLSPNRMLIILSLVQFSLLRFNPLAHLKASPLKQRKQIVHSFNI